MKNASNHRQFRTFALAVLLSSGPAAAADRHDFVGTDGGEWVLHAPFAIAHETKQRSAW
jgi:hypothetical protein